MPKILFVCSNNRLRSVIAMRAFAQKISDPKYFQVDSAGTSVDETRMNDFTQRFLTEHGLDSSAYTPKMISSEILDGVDYVFVMGRELKVIVDGTFGIRSKVFSQVGYDEDNLMRGYLPNQKGAWHDAHRQAQFILNKIGSDILRGVDEIYLKLERMHFPRLEPDPEPPKNQIRKTRGLER